MSSDFQLLKIGVIVNQEVPLNFEEINLHNKNDFRIKVQTANKKFFLKQITNLRDVDKISLQTYTK